MTTTTTSTRTAVVMALAALSVIMMSTAKCLWSVKKILFFCFWYHLRRSTAAAVVDLISHINEINFCHGIYLKPFECLIQLDSI